MIFSFGIDSNRTEYQQPISIILSASQHSAARSAGRRVFICRCYTISAVDVRQSCTDGQMTDRRVVRLRQINRALVVVVVVVADVDVLAQMLCGVIENVNSTNCIAVDMPSYCS